MSTVNTATISLEEYKKLKEVYDNVTENRILVHVDEINYGGWTAFTHRLLFMTRDEAISSIAKLNEVFVKENKQLKNENSRLIDTIDTLKSENEKLRAKTKWFSFLKFKRY